MALVMTGFVYFSAEAQEKTKTIACGKPEGKVCNKKSCYKTKYAENYAVCKGDYGYYICCESPNSTNSTFPQMPVAGIRKYRSAEDQGYVMENTTNADGITVDMAVPQSQSYPAYSANVATAYEGYYAKKGHIKVCENTDNVAAANRAPYKGCPAPAYDGPDRNIERNKNVSSPNSSFPTPPSTGNR